MASHFWYAFSVVGFFGGKGGGTLPSPRAVGRGVEPEALEEEVALRPGPLHHLGLREAVCVEHRMQSGRIYRPSRFVCGDCASQIRRFE